MPTPTSNRLLGNTTGTSTTLDPAAKGPTATLSNDNLTVSVASTNEGARSIASKADGLWVFECTVTTAVSSIGIVGISNSSQSLITPNGWCGQSVNSIGYSFTDGLVYNNGASLGSAGFTCAQGDTVMIEFSPATKEIWFKKGGARSAAFVCSAAGPYMAYPCIGGTPGSILTLNFGASRWVNGPPTSGFQRLF
jgi:hypothetical protein